MGMKPVRRSSASVNRRLRWSSSSIAPKSPSPRDARSLDRPERGAWELKAELAPLTPPLPPPHREIGTSTRTSVNDAKGTRSAEVRGYGPRRGVCVVMRSCLEPHVTVFLSLHDENVTMLRKSATRRREVAAMPVGVTRGPFTHAATAPEPHPRRNPPGPTGHQTDAIPPTGDNHRSSRPATPPSRPHPASATQ